MRRALVTERKVQRNALIVLVAFALLVGAIAMVMPALAAAPSVSTGPVVAHGGQLPVARAAAATYDVNFTEVGISPLTTWTVTFNGVGSTSAAGAETIALTGIANGTYPFTVTPVGGYTATPGSGNATVAGANVSVTIAFVQWHTITYTETGLPTGQVWGVYVDEEMASIANNTPSNVVWTLNNTFNGTTTYGNYTYSFVPVPGYDSVITLTTGACGSSATTNWCNVTNASASVAVAFHISPQQTVQFNETGLAAGTSWSVTFNGATITAATATITFGAVNGTYAFSVGGGGIPVNESTPASGTITVVGTTYQNISFFPYSPISISASFTSPFTLNGFSYFALPYNVTWSISLTNATMTALNAAGTHAFQQQLNITYFFTGCGPESFQHPCLLVWTTIVPFSFHTDLTATSANFWFVLTAANLTSSAPTSIYPGCPYAYGCGNPLVGEVLPQGQWEVSIWANWDNNTPYNNSNTVTGHIGFMVITSPFGQISTPTGQVPVGYSTISGNFSGYFVTGATLSVLNATNYVELRSPVYAPGVNSHAFSVNWTESVPGTYTIVLNLSSAWGLYYTFTGTVKVVPGVPFTYFNQTTTLIPGLGNGGSAALLITLGTIIGMIVMAVIGRGLWGGGKPAPAQPWSPTTTGGTGGTAGGAPPSGGTSGGGPGGTSSDMGGSGGGASPPS